MCYSSHPRGWGGWGKMRRRGGGKALGSGEDRQLSVRRGGDGLALHMWRLRGVQSLSMLEVGRDTAGWQGGRAQNGGGARSCLSCELKRLERTLRELVECGRGFVLLDASIVEVLPRPLSGRQCIPIRNKNLGFARGTSLIRNSAPVGPYRRTMPRLLRRS